MKLSQHLLTTAMIVFSALLVACNQQDKQQQVQHNPVAFHSADECHVCGMAITRFPGPKGQAINAQGKVKKFCSSAEMLNWWLQPENQVSASAIYVHDMSQGSWDKPDDGHLIEAQLAYYVVAPDMPGSMGTPIASFADQQAAELFAADRKTTVMNFSQLKDALLQQQLSSAAQHADHQHMNH